MINETGHEKAPAWAVSLDQVAPYLRRALARCRALGLPVGRFGGESSFPVCLLPILALAGFASSWRRRIRGCLVLPSGVWWFVVAMLIADFALEPPRDPDLAPLRITDPRLQALVFTVALVFAAASALTVESAVTLMRGRADEIRSY